MALCSITLFGSVHTDKHMDSEGGCTLSTGCVVIVLLVSERIAILGERGMFLDFVIWIPQSETLNPILLFT